MHYRFKCSYRIYSTLLYWVLLFLFIFYRENIPRILFYWNQVLRNSQVYVLVYKRKWKWWMGRELLSWNHENVCRKQLKFLYLLNSQYWKPIFPLLNYSHMLTPLTQRKTFIVSNNHIYTMKYIHNYNLVQNWKRKKQLKLHI